MKTEVKTTRSKRQEEEEEELDRERARDGCEADMEGREEMARLVLRNSKISCSNRTDVRILR